MQTILNNAITKYFSNRVWLRLIVLGIMLLVIAKASVSQVLITSQLPQSGITVKRQLWNLTLSNTGTGNEQIRISMVFTDKKNGIPVLSAQTGNINLLPGIKLLHYKDVQPVVYTILNYNYGTDASPTGFLPAGDFDICYTLIRKNQGETTSIAEDCSIIQVEPLNPPILTTPANNAVIEEQRPFFTWLPPAPLLLFSRLTYDLKLVEVRPKQQPEAALQQQLPIIYKTNLASNSFSFPASSTALDTGRLYAWQVTAVNNGMPVAASDVWTFTPKQSFTNESMATDNGSPYYKLTNGQSGGYFTCFGILKLAYENSINDKKVSLHIYDISSKLNKEMGNPFAVIELKEGQNYIDYNIDERMALINKHTYRVELINSKGEVWIAVFEYQKVKK